MTDPAERRRNPRGEGARLRGEILAAVDDLLAHGETVTLRSIARRAGIAAPSIYRHFADLDAIMLVVVERAFADLVDMLGRARDDHREPADRLRAICRRYLAFAHEQPARYRLMFGGVWDATAALAAHPQDEARLRTVGLDAFAVFVDAVRECARAGASTSADPDRDAAALWVGLHGLAELRETARLFPWPASLADTLVSDLAHLAP